jgi:hypothetical protein
VFENEPQVVLHLVEGFGNYEVGTVGLLQVIVFIVGRGYLACAHVDSSLLGSVLGRSGPVQ